jgi:hypothetical protein
MTTVLEECITEEQRSVVLFFCGQKNSMQKEFMKKYLLFFGRKCLSHKAVHNCSEKFSQRRLKFTDDARPSRSAETATEATVQRVEELIRADR